MGSIRARRPTKRRRVAPQEDPGWWEWANTALMVRSGGRCERCNRHLSASNPFGVSRHHRQRRRDGGDRLANLMLLCGSGTTGCHGHITQHPAEAVANGWIVPANGDLDPSSVPVRYQGGHLWLLDDHGTRRLVP